MATEVLRGMNLGNENVCSMLKSNTVLRHASLGYRIASGSPVLCREVMSMHRQLAISGGLRFVLLRSEPMCHMQSEIVSDCLVLGCYIILISHEFEMPLLLIHHA
jgi:hypothetical protein